MPVIVPIETAERDLTSLLEQLQLGETVTLVGSEGVPEALLVSLKSAPSELQSLSEWEARWDALRLAAIETAAFGIAQIEDLHGAGHADIGQPALLF